MQTEMYKEIKPLQSKLLEILKYFDGFCRAHGIIYYVHGGTALGALRHKGFIPWDDDVDIIMPQAEYDKFLELFQRMGDQEKYHLQIFFKSTQESVFSKLRMNGTTFIEENVKHKKIHQGIFIDIFAMQAAPEGKWKRYGQFLLGKFVVAQECAFKKNPLSASMGRNFLLAGLACLPRFFATRFALHHIKRYEGKSMTFFSRFTDSGSYRKCLMPKEMMGMPIELPFEDMKVFAPAEIEKFLELIYGDWRKIPTEEEIKKYLHYSFFDTERDFREYLLVDDFSDEKLL